MKNERCLIKKIIEFKEKMVKICIIFIGLTFLMGFYDERNIYVDLEEITVELGDVLPADKIDYINNYLINTNFFLEDAVPKDEDGQTTMVGTYNYYIVYRDEERMYSRLTNKRSTISVIDTIKPEIKLKETSLKFEYGSKINVDDIAVCYDLSKCSLYFDTKIDTKKVGEQEVIIVAVDGSNNVNEEIINITIKEKPKPTYYYSRSSSSYSEMNEHNNKVNSTLSSEQKTERRYALVEFAKQFEGNPYVYGGNSLTNGIDCSGFIKAIYNNFGYQMPRTAGSQGNMGISISSSQLLPGDLVTYHNNDGSKHIGIYIGNGKMIHAANPRKGIVIVSLYDGYRTYSRIIY